jgi:hypothetical protein
LYNAKLAREIGFYGIDIITADGSRSVCDYALKLGKDSKKTFVSRRKSYLLIYYRIFRKLYQTQSFEELELFFIRAKEDDIKIYQLFGDLGMIRKFLAISLNYPKIIRLLVKNGK